MYNAMYMRLEHKDQSCVRNDSVRDFESVKDYIQK